MKWTCLPTRIQGVVHRHLLPTVIMLLIAAGTMPVWGASPAFYNLPELGHAPSNAPVEKWFVAAADGSSVSSDTEGSVDEKGGMSEQEKIAEALNNPLSHLWLLFMQNDTTWWKGEALDDLNEDTKVMNTTLIQPVLSLQLTENWKTIIRPVIPIQSFDTYDDANITLGGAGIPRVDVDFERKTGLGDIVLWTAFSNQYKPPFVWGFGPTVMLPTASDDRLGSGKWSAGPMALAVNMTDKWIIGGVAQHWWSFAGDDDVDIHTNLGKIKVDRPDVNLTDFQYIVRYRYSGKTNIGAAPNVQYNWETDQLSLPVGIGFDTLIKIGPLPVKIGAEIHKYVVQDDKFGPDWRLRLYFVPVVPSPAWSKNALFGALQ